MKKFLSIMLIVALILSLGSITAHAESDSYGKANTCLAFRDSKGNWITDMPSGELMTILSVDSRDSKRLWVNWNGEEGSVIASGVDSTEEVPDILPGHTFNGITKWELNIRDSSYNLLDTIPGGSKVEVIGRDPNYSDRTLVNWKGIEGSILTSGILRTDIDSFIIIYKSSQTISMYKNGGLIVTGSVVTGNLNTHDTPSGVFSVVERDTNVTLKGADYEVKVSYWLRFYKGCGIHDSTRSAFGGEIYKTNGSHGCVNCPKSLAKTLYDEAYVGMTVVVI